MKRIILCIVFLLAPVFALAASNVTVTWSPGTESDLAGHYVYIKNMSKGDTTTTHLLKKDGGTPAGTVNMPDNTFIILDYPDAFFSVVVTAFDDVGNESDISIEMIGRIDTEPPVITLNGSSTMELERGTSFTDPGAIAVDNLDGNLTSSIIVAGTVDINTAGTYTLTYTVADESDTPFVSSVIRTVNIVDNAPPAPPTNVQVWWQQIMAWLNRLFS